MAPEEGRPSAWGEPAPTSADHDGSSGAAPGESVELTAGAAYPDPGNQDRGNQDRGNQDPGDQTSGDQDDGTGAQGWETVSPVMVSENGSGPAAGRRPSAPGWPPGPARATVKKREHRVLRGIRSGVALTVIALALGVAAAAGLGLIVWLIATAIHHAAAN